MFADTTLALKIETTEARLTRDATLAIMRSPGGAQAFTRTIGEGVAAFIRPGSPMNKVIGIGIDTAVDDSSLVELESLYHDRGEPVRVELSTLAQADVGRQLTERGYRLLGFENVLAVDLARQTTDHVGTIDVQRIDESRADEWKQVMLE